MAGRIGIDGEELLAIVDRLCAELGDGEKGAGGGGGGDASVLDRDLHWESLSDGEESLVLEIRSRLAGLAAALEVEPVETVCRRAVGVALDGSELLMRGEISRGNIVQLPKYLPSFVFLVALPLAGRDEAMGLSRRAAELTEEALGR